MEYEAAQDGAAQAKKKICLEAKAAFFAFDNEARKASGKKPQDEPHGDLVKRDMHSLSNEAVPMVYPAREPLNFAERGAGTWRKPGPCAGLKRDLVTLGGEHGHFDSNFGS